MRNGIVAIVICAAGCAGAPAFERIAESRRLSAELFQHFIAAVASTNRAVMAAGKPEAADATKQATASTAAVQERINTLKPLLEGLRYDEELQLLDEFREQFDMYRELDGRIHGLLDDSSNIRAQQLAAGPSREAAGTMAREAAAAAGRAADKWQARAHAAEATAAIREFEVLQWLHIPEDEDAVMDDLERQMSASASTARASLQQLARMVPGGAAPAIAALDRFLAVNTEMMTLSRRNSNVHALALALGTQGVLTARCEDALRSLQDHLGKRGFTATR